MSDSTQTRAETAAARRFWASLDNASRNDLGDEFVLGTFDWRDWFAHKPSREFLGAVDQERMLWESK